MELQLILVSFYVWGLFSFFFFFSLVEDPFSVLDLRLWLFGKTGVVSCLVCPYTKNAFNIKDVFNITVFFIFQ